MLLDVMVKNDTGAYQPFRCSIPGDLNGSEEVWPFPDSLGLGSFRRRRLGQGMSLTLANYSTLRGYQSLVRHTAPRITFAFVMEGRTSLANPRLRRSMHLQDGMCTVFRMPDDFFERSMEPGETMRALILKLSPERLSGPESSITDEPFCRILKMTPVMTALCGQIEAWSLSREPWAAIYRESKALELIGLTMRSLSGSGGGAAMAQTPAVGEAEKVRRASEILLNNIERPPGLEELARFLGISHPSLNRAFRRVHGSTVFEYLREKRMETACRLLEDPYLSLTEIAHQTGFSSSSHFATAFARRHGMPPSQFRRERLKKPC